VAAKADQFMTAARIVLDLTEDDAKDLGAAYVILLAHAGIAAAGGKGDLRTRRNTDAGRPTTSGLVSPVATIADVSPAAIRVARSYLGVDSGQSESVSDAAPAELLSRLGVLRPDGRLSQAGALMFCPSDRTLLSLVAIDVEGGDLLLEPADLAGLSLLEQIQSVEARLDVLNTSITLTGAFAEPRVRRLPPQRGSSPRTGPRGDRNIGVAEHAIDPDRAAGQAIIRALQPKL